MIRVYVANLHAYSAGRLIGDWFDLADYIDVEELREEIRTRVQRGTDAEVAVHDYDAPFRIGEFASLDDLMNAEQEWARVPHVQEDAYRAYLSWLDDWAEGTYDGFQEAYHGEFESLEAFAHDWLYDTDETYRAAYDKHNDARWTPVPDIDAWETDHVIVDGHVFASQ